MDTGNGYELHFKEDRCETVDVVSLEILIIFIIHHHTTHPPATSQVRLEDKLLIDRSEL